MFVDILHIGAAEVRSAAAVCLKSSLKVLQRAAAV